MTHRHTPFHMYELKSYSYPLPTERIPLGKVIVVIFLVTRLKTTSKKSVKGVSTADFTDLSLVTKPIEKSGAGPDGLPGGAFIRNYLLSSLLCYAAPNPYTFSCLKTVIS